MVGSSWTLLSDFLPWTVLRSVLAKRAGPRREWTLWSAERRQSRHRRDDSKTVTVRVPRSEPLPNSSRMRIRFDRRCPRFGSRLLLPLLASLALLCPSLAGVASAGVNTWTTNGPEGGGVTVFALTHELGDSLCRDEHRRNLQERQQRRELGTHERRTDQYFCLQPGHCSFDAAHALCRHRWRRRLQEHKRRGELDGHQHRPGRHGCYRAGHRSFGAATIYAGTDTAVCTRVATAGRAGQPSAAA